MTGPDLLRWRKSHGLTQRAAALVLGCSCSAICRWENENRPINAFLNAAVKEAEQELSKRKRRKPAA